MTEFICENEPKLKRSPIFLEVDVSSLPDLQVVHCMLLLRSNAGRPDKEANVTILPGGRYAVLSVEKNPSKINPAIRALHGDHLPDHGLIPD